MILDRSLHPVERLLVDSPLIPARGVVMVAVSGGADSMALVDALRRTRAGRLVVAHFDHRLRDDSARDAEHVAAYAREHGLEFVLGSEDVAARARNQRASIEEAAREARYGFLTATAQRVGAECVVTAHTRTDQVETILMRILRGSGRVGLAGIPERRGIFVRPLLAAAHADTRDYCTTRGVAFIDDPSNEDVRFERNRIRHDILPALRTVFPSIDNALLRLADHARREQREFEGRTTGWLDANVREEASGVWTIRLLGFNRLDDDDSMALLREALVAAGVARDVDRIHYERLLELVRNPHAGSSADLPGLSARREHDALVIEQRGGGDGRSTANPQRTLLSVPGRVRIGDWIVDARLVSRDEALGALSSRVREVAFFDADDIAMPLVMRPTQPGDRMRPFGLGGTKKLSDLFIDRKIPRRARERAIVVEGESIYWVPGVARSDIGPVGATTERVLRLKARRA